MIRTQLERCRATINLQGGFGVQLAKVPGPAPPPQSVVWVMAAQLCWERVQLNVVTSVPWTIRSGAMGGVCALLCIVSYPDL